MHALARAAVLLVTALVVAHTASATFLPCTDSSVEAWLNTSQQATNVHFGGFTVYPLTPSGKAYEGATASLQIMDVWELQSRIRAGSGTQACPTTATIMPAAAPYLLQAMDYASSQCEMTIGTNILAPHVLQTFVNVTLIRPDWPGFKMITTLSVVNQSHEFVVPATDNTYNVTYNLTYSTKTPKFSIRLENWPWIGPEGNASLKLFFGGYMYSKGFPANGSFTQRNRPLTEFQVDSPVTTFKTTFLRAFTVDGVDYVDNLDHQEDKTYDIPADQQYAIPIGIGICHESNPMPKHYSLLEYDPTISALFIGDESVSPSDSPSAASKKRLSPVAYAAPVAIIMAALIAFVVALKASPRFYNAVMPGGSHRATDRHAKVPTDKQTIDLDRNTEPPSPAKSSGWVASAKPAAV